MTIDLPRSLEEALQARAAQRQVTVADLVREALEALANNGTAASATSSTDTGLPDPEEYFAKEIATYERHRVELERDHWGRVALIRGDDVVGVFDTWETAVEEGHRRFGYDDKFMAHDIPEEVCEMFIGVP